MSFLNHLPENKQHVTLTIIAVLLTISSFLVICMSLQAAYLWIIIMLIMLLFFTTFTCSSTAQWRQNIGAATNNINHNEVSAANSVPPVWVIDVPPSYRLATGLPTGQTPPPSYKKLIFPPPYNESDKSSISDLDFNTNSLNTRSANLPEVFSNEHFTQQNITPNQRIVRENSSSSVQTLNFNICEGQ